MPVGDVADVGAGDVRVGGQLERALGRVEQFDQARPVGRQRRVDRLAAERLVEALVLGLRQRRRHAVGGVETRQRRGPVDARVLAVDEALPADRLEVRVDEVAVRLDVLGDVVEVVLGLELLELGAVGAGDADLAVVEVDLVVVVDEAHVVGLVHEGVALDQVDVGLVAQHDVVEELQRELGELDLAPR